MLENFVDAITVGRDPAVSGAEGLRDLRVIEAAYRASAAGQRQHLAVANRREEALA
jgi:glucose-fructose oxidoreductase